MNSDTKPFPANFRSLIRDFTNDLTTVFPEYDIYWRKWGDEDATDEELQDLFEHCSKVYPERFFDILYQNEEIFQEDSRTETSFFPKMSFKYLFNIEGVSDNSKKVMWKYLQLTLFTVVGNVDDKSSFGDTLNMFDGIDESMLQEKMQDAMSNISEVFDNFNTNDTNQESTETTEGEMKGNDAESPEAESPEAESQKGGMDNMEEEMKNMFKNMPKMEGMPNMENMQSHLTKLFDGKIGKLAKELAEEVADEFKDALGGDLDNANAQDVMKNLMKNPNKIKGLMKTVSGRLDDKMKSGEISRDDIMKEAGDFLNQVKSSGGDAGVNEMLKSMMKGMGGLGKNAKINKNALNQMMNMSGNKEKTKKKAEEKKKQIEKEKASDREAHFERIRQQNKMKAQFKLEQTNNPDKFVFKLDGEDVQEKSFVHPDLIREMKAEEATEKESKTVGNADKKKKKKKKNN
tara:strand:+ start:7155 stop:8534 length:1380 start_codon:yes stop_codon:yes gene_type:complete